MKTTLSKILIASLVTLGFTACDFLEEESQTRYTTQYVFETEDGLKLQAVCDEGSNPPIYKEGDFINIVYPSNDPKGFEVNDYPNTLKLPIILISLSIMLLVFAIVLIII